MPTAAVEPQVEPQLSMPAAKKSQSPLTAAPSSEEKAYCRTCQAEQSMCWKPKYMRGRRADSWFTCAVCGNDALEIKMLTYAEAVEKNRRDKAVPF